MPKRFGHGEVKRDPDLERWNNVRDNVDQVCDVSRLHRIVLCDPPLFHTQHHQPKV
jgi:hypothetical protein